MGGRNCCVKNCRRRSHDHRGRKIPNGLTFHRFPAWRRDEGAQTSELTRRRRAAWVAAVGRSSITFNHVPASMRVCSRHFQSGKPAYEMLESDQDWVPSLHLGHGEGNARRAERLPLSAQSKTERKQRWTSETRPPDELTGSEAAGGAGRLALRPWRDLRSLLQSALQSPTSKRPEDQTREPRPAVRTPDLSFRDFFRDALQGSLEATSRARAQSQRPPSVFDQFKVELNFKVSALKTQTCEEPSPSSSSCLSCVRLQWRIQELEEKLFHLSGQQEDMQTSPAFNRAPIQPDQVLQSPDPVHTGEEGTEWMEPLSPPEVDLCEGDQDVDSADRSTPSSPAASHDDSSKQRPHLRPRFKKVWLRSFWFLHYSPALDQMWCHVCRHHADGKYQNLALIKGSRLFKVDNIRKHSDSHYHRDSLQRYRLHTRTS
ncbi:uncharacterized protein [Trachinotus anak]|uniref:uncharacterized protein isoform X2 n=1 Tax=Trachinotus anak TaxID=443729 RepID=UPI0039F22BD6